MATDQKQKYKVDYAAESEAGMSADFRPVDLCRYGHFREEYLPFASEKGQLFVVADAKIDASDRNVAEMAIDLIREHYFAYPSEDIGFCLKRAFDIANRKIYQYAQANGLERQIGAACSALVLTDRHAYIAHVGDCRVYGISLRRSEKLTQDHVRVIEMMPDGSEYDPALPEFANRQTALQRALGVSLGLKVDVIGKIPVDRDEYFALATNAFKSIDPEEIRRVLFSGSPKTACRQLMKMGRRRDPHSCLTLQIIKIYNEYEEAAAVEGGKGVEAYASSAAARPRRNLWIHYLLLLSMILVFSLTYRDSISQRLPEMLQEAIVNNGSLLPGGGLKTPVEDWSNDLLLANRYFEDQQFGLARQHYQRVLSLDKNNATALAGIRAIADNFVKLGDKNITRGNWSTALIFYKQASSLCPDDRDLLDKVIQIEEHAKESAARIARRASSTSFKKSPAVSSLQTELTTRPVETTQRPLWKMPGLDVNTDYRMPHKDDLHFMKNLRVKKVYHMRNYPAAEVEVKARVESGDREKKYGIIFGHRLGQDEMKPESFYLFSFGQDNQYAVQRITSEGLEYLDAGALPDDVQHREEVDIRVKWENNVVIYWINGFSLNILEVDENILGGVGFYCDGNIQVEFTDMRITPTSLP